MNMNAGETVQENELAPSWKDIRRFWEKSDNCLKPVDVTGGLLRGQTKPFALAGRVATFQNSTTFMSSCRMPPIQFWDASVRVTAVALR